MPPIVIGEFGTVTIGFVQRLEDLEFNYNIVGIGQNTEKGPGD